MIPVPHSLKPVVLPRGRNFTAPRSCNTTIELPTAIVYCEANFGELDGKTANGLVRHSEAYNILSVIDSKKAGLDSGRVLDNCPNGIPIVHDIEAAVPRSSRIPDFFIIGVAPANGKLSIYQRRIAIQAIEMGMNIVNGLHEFLNDDAEFVAVSKKNNVKMIDIRRPRDRKLLQIFSGRIDEVTCPRVAILGTDCAIGKRTTANLLARALNDVGIKATMVYTGQTGLIQGARYGVALDAVPSQYCAGELEDRVVAAFRTESPDIIIIEGQGALSHPAFSTSSFILRGSKPDAVILQHAPARVNRCDFDQMPMPDPATEINLIQTFSEAKVIGLTINHEKMNAADVAAASMQYEQLLGVPALDALTCNPVKLVEMVKAAFPDLGKKLFAASL